MSDTNIPEPNDSQGIDYGLDIMERFIYSIDAKVNALQQDLFYLKQWLKLTREGTPTAMKVKSHTTRRK